MKIFIDSSVLIRHYYGVEKAVKLLDFVINENEAFISPNVVEETLFKLIYIETERIFGKTGKYIVKEKFEWHKNAFSSVRIYMEDFLIESINSEIMILLESHLITPFSQTMP